jgi:hypothetical protein
MLLSEQYHLPQTTGSTSSLEGFDANFLLSFKTKWRKELLDPFHPWKDQGWNSLPGLEATVSTTVALHS